MNPQAVILFAEWCDGPLSGLALHRDWPHLYVCEFRPAEGSAGQDAFVLVPLDAGELPDLLRYLVGPGPAAAWAAHAGDGPPPDTVDTDALPGPSRHQMLGRWAVVRTGLTARAGASDRAHTEFSPRGEPAPDGREQASLWVRWEPADPPQATLGEMEALARRMVDWRAVERAGWWLDPEPGPDPGDPGGEDVPF